jgi:molybdopterin converting factor small subunit
MKVTMRIFGDISEDIGKRYALDLEEGATVETAAEKVSELSGQRRGFLGEYRIGGKDLALLVNGNNVELGEGLLTRLRDGDEFVIFQPTAGG